MGEAALAACAEISQIHLAMPNKHCLLINLQPLGLENNNEVFVPTDEPHGQIEATVAR
jgi:urate oxidase